MRKIKVKEKREERRDEERRDEERERERESKIMERIIIIFKHTTLLNMSKLVVSSEFLAYRIKSKTSNRI